MKLSGNVIVAKLVLIVAVFASLVGCSGGGGGSNGFTNLSGTAPSATVQLASSTLQLNESTTVSAQVLDASGHGIPGVTVDFSTTLGSFNPSTGSAVTDGNGNAAVQLLAGTNPGTGIVTAATNVGGTSVSQIATFSVAFPVITISTPALGLATLAPGGSTSVTVTLTDSTGAAFTSPVDVSFSSTFSSTGKATLISPVRSANGVASSTYTATGGVGTDTITVSVGSSSVTANITVNAASAASISFVSATPTSITLKGMGGVGGSETSTVVFKVLDSNGLAKAGQTVDFAPNTTVGGLTLTSFSGSSDANGLVSTIVQSGIVATPVRVTASLRGTSPLIATQSDQLSVSTGIPAQGGMSLAVVTHNVEAANVDGTTDVFTVFLADHYGNPVPDGTVVNFSAQVGQITPSCSTTNGRCTATWTSSGERTPDGRAAILAYAIGEESFADPNANGVAEGPDSTTCLNAGSTTDSAVCGEFTDTTQAWRDDAHTATYAPAGTVVTAFPGFPGDLFIDFNGSGKVDRDGIFNGILRPSSVSGARTKHVFQNNVIVLSTSAAKINNLLNSSNGNSLNPTAGGASGSTVINGSVQDANPNEINPLPAGTTISVAALSSCLSVSPSSFTVPNTAARAATRFTSVVSNSCLAGAGSPGALSVTTTTPSGAATTRTFTFSW